MSEKGVYFSGKACYTGHFQFQIKLFQHYCCFPTQIVFVLFSELSVLFHTKVLNTDLWKDIDSRHVPKGLQISLYSALYGHYN